MYQHILTDSFHFLIHRSPSLPGTADWGNTLPTTNTIVVDRQSCTASKCLERGDIDSDCCSASEEASCADGYHYSRGNACFDFGLLPTAYTTCCSKDEKIDAPEAFDWSECDPRMCSSPGDRGVGTDCFAGSATEECSCTAGYAAKETGFKTYDWEGHVDYYEYTCCPPQAGSDGKNCGMYTDARKTATLIGVGVCLLFMCICCGAGCSSFLGKREKIRTTVMQMQPPMYTPPVDNEVNPYAF